MKSVNVLILEDDVDLLHSLAEYLSGRGCDCHCASNTTEAWKIVDSKLDILILDLHLGNGDDGLDFFESVKTRYPSIQCILMTGYDSLPVRLKSFAFGVADYMKKPIFPAELYARMQRLWIRRQKIEPLIQIEKRCKLSPKEEKLLTVLLQAKGEFVSKQVLGTVVETDNALYVVLSRLKKRLPRNYKIYSQYGRGWRLEVL